MGVRSLLSIVLMLAFIWAGTLPVSASSLTVSFVEISESNSGASNASQSVNFIIGGVAGADVTINYSNDGECTLNGSTSGALTISSGQSSTQGAITAINDESIEGQHVCEFSFITASSDATFNGLNRTYEAVINDNDGLPDLDIVVSEDSHIKEGNLSFRNVYSVIRGAEEPVSPIILTVWTDNQCALQKTTGEGYTSQISIEVQNYAVPIIVVANDDEVAEGDHTCHVQHRVQTSDPAYKDNLVDSRYITIEDNDGSPPAPAQSTDSSEPEAPVEETADENEGFVGEFKGDPIRLHDPDRVSNLFVIMTVFAVVFGTVLGWWKYGRYSPGKPVDKS